MTKKNEKTVEKQPEHLKDYSFKKGQSGNPNGRPLGRKNFNTLFKEALKKLAELNEVDPESIEVEILSNGIKRARSGDFRFFKDLMDRRYGQAVKNVDHTTDGNPLPAQVNVVFKDYTEDGDSTE